MQSRSIILSLAILIVVASSALADTYPQFDISGYKKWRYFKTDVTPSSNYFAAQTHLGGLTTSLNSGPWEERLSLMIASKLSELLSVSYDIEQEPETPQKSDVKVKYGNTELVFGNLTAVFSENEFVSATKYLNGMMLSSYGDNYTFKLVPSSKIYSNSQALSSLIGNNTRGPYSLGHGSIIENSEKIILNNVLLKRGVDYTIDYFQGQITFANILSLSDSFTYSYEYTNIVDLFFPTISSKDFFGISGSYKAKRFFYEKTPEVQAMPLSGEAEETLPAQINLSSSTEASSSTDESTGLYQLSNSSIVEFSETVKYRGIILKKFEDYSIDYKNGSLFVISDISPSPSDPITVKYGFYLTSQESVNLNGLNSIGPYLLPHKRVSFGSETIFVDGKQKNRDIDYSFDYAEGRITFKVPVPIASNISASYSFTQMTMPSIPEGGNSITVGGTYLKETSKKGAGSATITVLETRKGSEINNNLLNLKHFPLDSTQPITVKVNGADYTNFYVPTSDAQSLPMPYINDSNDQSDGYSTGTIKFNTLLNTTDEVLVLYTYKKSVFGRFTGVGNGSQGPYYLTNINSVIPGTDANLIVRSQGTSVIETYSRNSSRETSDGKYKINYSYPYIPYITFNDPFPIQKSFEITYYYIPTSSAQENSDLNHDVVGVTSQIIMGNTAKIDAALGVSKTDRAVVYAPGQDTIAGSNSRGPYKLSNANVIENSEKIFVNGFQQNRDVDYFINYTDGQITFYYLTIRPVDTILAQYNFQTAGGISGDTQLRTGYAYKVSPSINIGPVSLSATIKEMDPDYSPMESTNIGSGSQQKAIDFAYAPNSFFATKANILETKNQIGTNKGFFTWNTDRGFQIDTSPLGLAQVGVSFRNYKSLDDLLPGATQHSTDSLANIVALSLAPKTIENSIIKFGNRNAFSKKDSKNNIDGSSTLITFFHTANTLNVTDRFNCGFDYQFSEPISRTSEAESSHQVSKDTTYDLGWDLTFKPLKKLTAKTKIINHDQKDLITATSNGTRNQSINFAFDPVNNISTALSKSRQETLSVQVEKENPMTEQNQYSINLTPLSQLALGYVNSDDRSFQESGAKSNGIKHNATASLNPFPFLHLGTGWNLENRFTSVLNGTVESASDLITEIKNYTASTNFRPLNLFNLTAEFSLEDYSNKNDIGTINTRTNNIIEKCGISFSPISFVNVSGNYAQKLTRDLILDVEKPKENYDLTTSVSIFSGGTLSQKWEQERNLGEIQAGVVTNYDILKISNTYSLNVNLPQSSTILSSMVVTASYKNVIYSDMLIPTNSFVASLLQFEGTLNF